MDSEQYKESLAKELETRPLSIVVLESLVSVITILVNVTGNMLVLLTIYKNTRLRRPANLYIVSLAVTDLLMGISACPLRTSAVITGDWKFGRFGCWLSFILGYSVTDASILTMFLIAVNRYYKIVKPNRYSSVFSLRFIITSIVLAWVLALAFPWAVSQSLRVDFHPAFVICLPLIKAEHMAVMFTAVAIWVLLPFCFMSLLYYKIWIFIRQHNAHMNQSQVNLEELKLTKSLFVVVGSFLVCYFPYAVISIVKTFFQPRLPRQLYFFFAHMIMISSCLNPLIYGAMNRKFRKEFLKILSPCCAKKPGVAPQMREEND